MKYAFIRSRLQDYKVTACCQVLEISRSGYYASLERPASARESRRKELAIKIQAVHQENRCVYAGSIMRWLSKAKACARTPSPS